MKTDVLFVGFLMTDEKMKSVNKQERQLLHYAANKFQWNIINGLLENEDVNSIHALTNTFLSCYPNYPQIFFCKEEHSQEKLKIQYLPFVNLRVLKSATIALSTLYYSFKWINRCRKEKKIIITYAMYTPFMLANYFLKFFTRCPQIIVVLDLPEYMNLSDHKQSFVTKMLVQLNIKLAWKIINKYEGFILLTEQMAKKLKVSAKPYTVIEGFADKKALTKVEYSKNKRVYKKEDTRIIMYAGTLNKKYGVYNLVKAFEYIDEESYELWICGAGDCEDFIKEKARKDKRIKYFGVIDNDQVLDLELQANLLINPRPTDNEFTKYSFPSKNMEYMSTGVPVITTKLPGMPVDYNNYVYFINDESPIGIAETIKAVGKLPNDELVNFGDNAKGFLFESKNYISQGRKIFDLIKHVVKQK